MSAFAISKRVLYFSFTEGVVFERLRCLAMINLAGEYIVQMELAREDVFHNMNGLTLTVDIRTTVEHICKDQSRSGEWHKGTYECGAFPTEHCPLH
jgi:hypothetical protein